MMFSGSMPIDTPEEQITCTEKRILCDDVGVHQQRVLLSNLCAERDLLSPVFRVPPETLEIIFIHGACNYYNSDGGGHFTPHIPTWVNVSYVCSHWCNITLNCLTLWTCHFTTSLHWTEELLLRLKDASLKVSCTFGVIS